MQWPESTTALGETPLKIIIRKIMTLLSKLVSEIDHLVKHHTQHKTSFIGQGLKAETVFIVQPVKLKCWC